ncbi:MAG TPA: hypothetical protein VD833_09640 [Vicinamibacterales bacterium]|nr:hypothetical protein [Vicinamibacterales bacterium]
MAVGRCRLAHEPGLHAGGAPWAWPWGAAGDIRVPADHDADHVADAAVIRQGDAPTWHVRLSATGTDAPVQWGRS